MAWPLLLPAAAILVSLLVLTHGLRSVGEEVHALRRSLRRTTATAVAGDELTRASDRLRDRSRQVRIDATRRVALRPRWWNRPDGPRR